LKKKEKERKKVSTILHHYLRLNWERTGVLRVSLDEEQLTGKSVT
jgi:hypothetical protein